MHKDKIFVVASSKPAESSTPYNETALLNQNEILTTPEDYPLSREKQIANDSNSFNDTQGSKKSSAIGNLQLIDKLSK